MKNINWTRVVIWAMVIIVAALLLLKVVGCNKETPDHANDKKTVDNDYSIVKDLKQKYRSDSAKWNAQIVEQEKEIASLKINYQTTERELYKSQNKVAQLIGKINVSKVLRDTVQIVIDCDTLARQAENLSQFVNQQTEYIAQQENNYESKLRLKDSVIAGERALRLPLEMRYEDTYQKYNHLYTDYNKLSKRNKKERFIGRVTAATTLILGAVLIIKK